VPLVIKLPSATPVKKQTAEKRIDGRVGLVDVMPTMLQVVGIPVPGEMQGESLLGMITPTGGSTTAQQDRNTYAESDYGFTAYGWSWLRALRTGKYLYVDAPRPELYDQAADSKAEHDLSGSAKAVTTTLAAQLDTFRQKTANKNEAAQTTLDP